MHRAFYRTVGLLSASAAAFVLAVAPAQAQIPAPPVENDEMQGRLERLEKQNKDLADSLRQLHGLLAKQAATARPRNADELWQANDKEMPAGADLDPALVHQILQKSMPPADGEPGMSKKEVEGIVNNWWSAKEKAKKEADEIKKLEDEAKGYEVGKDLAMKTVWNHGLWAETADKAFRVHVGGRAQFDTVWMQGEDAVQFGDPGGTGQIRDGYNFRRGRLAVEGTFWEVINFNTEWDFINTFNANAGSPNSSPNIANTPVPTDLWIEITKLPIIGNLRFGNQKPQISFEHLTSSRFLNFLERSFMFDAWVGGLNNGFIPGIQMWNYSRNERMTWSLGVYKNNQSVFGWNQGNGEYDATGRITWLPVYAHEGRCLVHLGLGASVRDPDDGRFRQRARTMLRNGPAALHTALVDTTFNTDRQILVVPEFAMVWGPFSMQAEYFANWFRGTNYQQGGVPFIGGNSFASTGNVGTTYYQGAYCEALYFLTGEHRPYNKFGGSGAAFTRVIPYRPFYFVPGEGRHLFSSGAWQVAARYQWIDLQDKGVPGGTLQDVTLGLNWFLNPNLKFQWNYSIAHRDYDGNAADGNVQGCGMRVAWDF